MTDKELLTHEISIIQEIIKRMAGNSFLIKGWAISIMAIVLTLLKEEIFEIDIVLLFLLLAFPTLSFWYLDAYFLRKERLYRELYRWNIKNRLIGNNEFPYDLNINRFTDDIPTTSRTMFSSSILIFYMIPIVILITLIAYRLLIS